MDIQIKTYNEFLGNLARKVLADTDLTDINPGSVLLTLLEAIAESDFNNNVAILNLLNLGNIDSLYDEDLDAKGFEVGIERLAPAKSQGKITITDSGITKQSSSLFLLKPAPQKGTKTIYVGSAQWDTTTISNGETRTFTAPYPTLYIGRNTYNFEGPIKYNSITNNSSFFTITLVDSLQNNHLITEEVVNSQNTIDRVIQAGTLVMVPANNITPEVRFKLLRKVVIPAGENTITNVDIIAEKVGVVADVAKNTIVQFVSIPFTNATVTNPESLIGGRDREKDEDYKDRIKNYANLLHMGTQQAILNAILGISSSDEGKTVTSTSIQEPGISGVPATIYIDDSTGFQPSYEGQNLDLLIYDAIGGEEFLQLANYPLPRPQVVNSSVGPFVLRDGMNLTVYVDEQEEIITFNASSFANIAFASILEVVLAINESSSLFKARLSNNSSRILIYPIAFDAEKIKVVAPISDLQIANDANTSLLFPTDYKYSLKLYKNNILLKEKQKTAFLETTSFVSWNINPVTTYDLILSVDGCLSQTRYFDVSDFSIGTFNVSPKEWVTVFNRKFSGITAELTASSKLILSSNKTGDNSSIRILGGSLSYNWFGSGNMEAYGQSSDYVLNKQNGVIRLSSLLVTGDQVRAGSDDNKGYVVSSISSSGEFDLSKDSLEVEPIGVICPDATSMIKRSVQFAVGDSITIDYDSTLEIMKISTNSSKALSQILPGDYVYIPYKVSSSTWCPSEYCGLHKIYTKGDHTVPANYYISARKYTGGISYIHAFTIESTSDFFGFSSDAYPQIWKPAISANAKITDVISSLNDTLVNIYASLYQTNSVKITSTTEDGTISFPVATGKLGNIFNMTTVQQNSLETHIANKVNDINVSSYFKRTLPVETTLFGEKTYTYKDYSDFIGNSYISGSNTDYQDLFESTNLVPSISGYDSYINVYRGNNKGTFHTIKSYPIANGAGTQYLEPTNSLETIQNFDYFNLIENSSISSNDSLVVIMDQDSVFKRIEVPFFRLGKVNTGSGGLAYIPTNYDFSADDKNNEPGIDFSNLGYWGKSFSEFMDYSVWFRARNYYSSNGIASTDGKFIVRANDFGPNGEKIRIALDYPLDPKQSNGYSYLHTPENIYFTYYFGSGTAKAIGVSNGMQFSVTDLGSNIFRYKFRPLIDLVTFGTIVPGDILAIKSDTGIQIGNRGSHVIKAVDAINGYVDIYNPNAEPTSTLGSPEITDLTCVADMPGSNSIFDLTTSGTGASTDGDSFYIQESLGVTMVWYDSTGTTPIPTPIIPVYRSIKISITNADSSAILANKTIVALNANTEYSCYLSSSTTLVCTSTVVGNRTLTQAGTTAFTVTITDNGSNATSLNGTYFVLGDNAGKVKVWIDIDGQGTPEPSSEVTDRSIRISAINSGDNANTVAGCIATKLSLDSEFSISYPPGTSSLTITSSSIGARIDTYDGIVPTGFNIVKTQEGTNAGLEVITDSSLFNVFALEKNLVSDIVLKVNESNIAKLVALPSVNPYINLATKDETVSVAYGHNPNPTFQENYYVELYDSENWIKSFDNINPNFVLKTPFKLQGQAPLLYNLQDCLNYDSTDLGEFFNLVPITINNIHHQLTNSTLSQLPLVADVAIAKDKRRIQIKSKQSGSSGAVYIAGGTANNTTYEVKGDSNNIITNSIDYIKTRVNVFPDTVSVGDYVKISSVSGTLRKSVLSDSDSVSISVSALYSDQWNYQITQKSVIPPSTSIDILDVSVAYGKNTGTIYRWTSDIFAGNLGSVIIGDTLVSSGDFSLLSSGWFSRQVSRSTGDGKYPGMIIVGMGDLATSTPYIDIINPMDTTPDGTYVLPAGAVVKIVPSFTKRIFLPHRAKIKINKSEYIAPGIIGVTTAEDHNLDIAETVTISGVFSDGDHSVIVTDISDPVNFTYADVGILYNTAGGYCVNTSGGTATRYKVEKIGFANLIKISRVDGSSPYFLNSGVAIDDYCFIRGTTFGASNNGLFRVRAIEDDSIIIENNNAVEQISTINSLNDAQIVAKWTMNSTTVTGIAGAFDNVSIGDWVKKISDADSSYVPVIGKSSVSLTLGQKYLGESQEEEGVVFNQAIDYEKGTYLKSNDDLQIFTADSVIVGDTLKVSNLHLSTWFNSSNTGSFEIKEAGTNPLPFIRVENINGRISAPISMSGLVSSFSIYENANSKYSSYKKVNMIVRDPEDSNSRILYLTPGDRAEKISFSNSATIETKGKLGYNATDVSIGTDGYYYYTGLLRETQRTIDGYEVDKVNFPGIKGEGTRIEILPPLVKNINISLAIIYNEGINIIDTSNSIKIAVSDYVASLGVGESIVLSDIIVLVKNIKGILAVTFNVPAPTEKFISVAKNEKAYIKAEGINLV